MQAQFEMKVIFSDESLTSSGKVTLLELFFCAVQMKCTKIEKRFSSHCWYEVACLVKVRQGKWQSLHLQ